MHSPQSTNTPDGKPLGGGTSPVAALNESPSSAASLPAQVRERRDYDYDRTLRGHTGSVRTVTTLSDGRVVTAGDDSHVVVWRAMTNQEYALARKEVQVVHEASLPPDASLHFWKYQDAFDELLRERMVEMKLQGHTKAVTCVVTMPDGRLITGGEDCALRVWSEEAGRSSWSSQHLLGHAGAITCIDVIDERTIVSGSTDGSVRVWRENSSGEWRGETLLGHTGAVQALDHFSDGGILSAGVDGCAMVWRRLAEEWTRPLVVQTHEPLNAVKVITDAAFVATGTCSASMWRYNAEASRWNWHKLDEVSRARILTDGSVVAFRKDAGVGVWRCDGETGWRTIAVRSDWRDMVDLAPMPCGGFLLRTGWMDEGWWKRDLEVVRVLEDEHLVSDVMFTRKGASGELRDVALADGRFGIVHDDGSVDLYRPSAE